MFQEPLKRDHSESDKHDSNGYETNTYGRD